MIKCRCGATVDVAAEVAAHPQYRGHGSCPDCGRAIWHRGGDWLGKYMVETDQAMSDAEYKASVTLVFTAEDAEYFKDTTGFEWLRDDVSA